ncbi:MAG: lysophospholipid acyltransferase family protein [Candidatus Binatia bacterium]
MAVVVGRASAPVVPRRRGAHRRVRIRRRSSWFDRPVYLALRAAVAALGALPLAWAMRATEAAALLVYAVDRPHRRIGMRNLAIAFPERLPAERRRILRASFLNLGRMAAELAHLPRLTAADLRAMVQFEDEPWWAENVAKTRDTGGLILSGHFGNWELLVFAHGMRGFPVSMVHRAIANPFVDRWINALRARAGTRLVRKAHAAGGVLRALRERQLLVLPFDQNSTRGLGVFVDFFGLAASTNSGIARLSLRAGAPVVPVFIVRQGRSARHRVHVLPIMDAERSGDLEGDVRHNTQRFSDVFESMVRRYPEQWFWVHKRWKTRPAGQPRLY